MITYKELLPKVSLKLIGKKENSAVFSFEPLPVGYGHTLGSVLRRVLLSSIPGSAVTRLKIEGISQPFSTIPGVREDVIEIVLNVKKIRLKIFNDQPAILKATKSGPGQLKVSDFEVVGDGELINNDLVIANLADKKTKVSFELTAEPGVGFETAEEHPSNKIGVIPVDSIFTPIVNVSYSVEQARLGQATNLESLKIEIETDGTVDPETALNKSCGILEKFFAVFAKGTGDDLLPQVGQEEGVVDVASGIEKDLDVKEAGVPIEELGLSTRTTNALVRSKIKTLGDLFSKKGDLVKVKGLGQKGLSEVGDLLTKQGWR